MTARSDLAQVLADARGDAAVPRDGARLLPTPVSRPRARQMAGELSRAVEATIRASLLSHLAYLGACDDPHHSGQELRYIKRLASEVAAHIHRFATVLEDEQRDYLRHAWAANREEMPRWYAGRAAALDAEIDAGGFPVVMSHEWAPFAASHVYGLASAEAPARVRYVGQSAVPAGRFAGHLNVGAPNVRAWLDAQKAAGVGVLVLLLEGPFPEEEADLRELTWIRALRARGQADLNARGVRGLTGEETN